MSTICKSNKALIGYVSGFPLILREVLWNHQHIEELNCVTSNCRQTKRCLKICCVSRNFLGVCFQSLCYFSSHLHFKTFCFESNNHSVLLLLVSHRQLFFCLTNPVLLFYKHSLITGFHWWMNKQKQWLPESCFTIRCSSLDWKNWRTQKAVPLKPLLH